MHSLRHSIPLWRAAALLVVASLLLAACGGAAPASPASSDDTPAAAGASTQRGNLVVLEWAGYELPQFHEPFTEQYPQVRVDYSFFSEDAEAFAKLLSGFNVDLMHPCNPWWGLYVEQGLVQPIDTAKLSNFAGLDPDLVAMGRFNGQQYFIPWDWGYEAILVRTDKVETLPQSWADLANPEYAGRLAIWDSGEANHIIAALALGFDPWNTTPEQDAQIKQWLIDLKPNLLTYWVDFSELAQQVGSGDVWVASNAWTDTYMELLDQNVPVAYIDPAEGMLGFVCGFGLSSRARDVDLALAYIDAAIAPQSMANFSNEYGYGPANRDALPLIDPEIIEMFRLDDPNALQNTVFYQSLTQEQRQRITTMWNDVKAAR
jgi:spermidine/putrescine transport system substrate-binding protein